MSFRLLFAKLTSMLVLLCLFPCTLQAALPRALPSMSVQAVHDTVVQLGIGKGVYARISSSGPGPLEFSYVGGRIVSISDKSVDLSVRKGHTDSVQTFAYKDIDELHAAPVSGKRELLAVAIIGGLATLLLVVVLHHHPPAPEIGVSPSQE